MKKFLVFLCFFNVYLSTAVGLDSGHQDCQPLRVYLCSRLTESAKTWNNEVTAEIGDALSLFRPQDVDLSQLAENEFDWAAYQADFAEMKLADLLLVLPPYGRDCAWEIGWFCGNEKPAIAYVEVQGDWFRDAMVKGGLTAIITNNAELYEILLQDSATALKSYLISSKQNLSETIKQIYTEKA